MAKNILLVDDEAAFLLSFADGLRHFYHDLNIFISHNGHEAMDVLKSRPVDLVITDLRMPECDGFELLDYICQSCPEIPVFVVSVFCSFELPEKLSRLGVKAHFEKPVDLIDIKEKIGHVLYS